MNAPLVIAGTVLVGLLFRRRAEAAEGGAMPAPVTGSARIAKIVKSAAKYNIPPAVALAIADVEASGGSGFLKDGRMIIRFEPHIFAKYAKGAKQPLVERTGTQGEWRNYDRAAVINPYAAKMAISMGMFQIMGFNHKVVGYPTVDAMFAAYSSSQDAQIQGFFDFCAQVTGDEYDKGPQIKLDKAAREGNWLAFARGYNGRGQKGYDKKMKARYDYWVSKGYKGI